MNSSAVRGSITAITLFFFCTLSYAELPKIEIVSEVDWSEGKDVSDYKGSLISQISTLVLEEMGYEVNVYFTPWARALRMTMDGTADGVAGIYYTEQRAESLIYSSPVATRELALFKRKDRDIVFNGDLTALAPYKVGVVRNYTYGETFDNASYLEKVVAIKPSNNLRMLLANRVDLIIDSTSTIEVLLKQFHPAQVNDVIALEPIVQTENVYFAFSKTLENHQELTLQFNETLSKLKRDGSIQALESNYIINQQAP
ncbi:transporter substrate-binding domain-containing protein [Glaciecola sp. XM2]|uniref:substrate-binding periplasmic protein n=1 Tax=Glaciecola sp. XM2 TaxID=1914931 RepID=UPI001BDEA3C9|nr:transporter substrate-binding domain-containing protein [Glaciecola sp. XM2]MBT1450541.1 transporter substrate-binding domain-containing protein [Glaciecola sp. XM2]